MLKAPTRSVYNGSIPPTPDFHSCEDEETSVTSETNVGTRMKAGQEQGGVSDHSFELRTLVMKGFPSQTSLLDIVKTIRGGQLLNVYMLPREKLAHISFVEASAAAAFLTYSEQATILILGQKVSVRLR